jgi:hypothetical protein
MVMHACGRMELYREGAARIYTVTLVAFNKNQFTTEGNGCTCDYAFHGFILYLRWTAKPATSKGCKVNAECSAPR